MIERQPQQQEDGPTPDDPEDTLSWDRDRDGRMVDYAAPDDAVPTERV